jgi:hypothetical protein
MSRRIWQVQFNGTQHVVNLEWNSLTLSGELYVDDGLIERWGPLRKTKEVNFKVGDKEATFAFILKSLKPTVQALRINDFLLDVDSGGLEVLAKSGTM